MGDVFRARELGFHEARFVVDIAGFLAKGRDRILEPLVIVADEPELLFELVETAFHSLDVTLNAHNFFRMILEARNLRIRFDARRDELLDARPRFAQLPVASLHLSDPCIGGRHQLIERADTTLDLARPPLSFRGLRWRAVRML